MTEAWGQGEAVSCALRTCWGNGATPSPQLMGQRMQGTIRTCMTFFIKKEGKNGLVEAMPSYLFPRASTWGQVSTVAEGSDRCVWLRNDRGRGGLEQGGKKWGRAGLSLRLSAVLCFHPPPSESSMSESFINPFFPPIQAAKRRSLLPSLRLKSWTGCSVWARVTCGGTLYCGCLFDLDPFSPVRFMPPASAA
jgi:hypothetical protein